MGNITGFLEHIFLLFLLIHHCVGPPTKKQEAGDPAKADDQKANLDDFGLEYNRYLTEVVNALESDPEFRKKLETAQEADFRNGKVAAELEYVNHHVRTKLDELKRVELQRLRDLIHQAEEVEQNNVNPNHVNPGHVDHTNPHSFEAADLHKLITQVRHDLAELDKKRRDEFKEYEMQKKFEQEQKIKTMDEEHKKQYLHELEEQKKKHQKHEPLHHPGSRAQLEEVWEKEDHMKNQQFNPKAFFMMHDVNGDGYWDEEEVKALFVKDLDKLYEAGASEDDMREREEEMERMREHVFKEADSNRDRLLSYDEFLAQTKRDEFNRDEGWESIDTQPQYTQQEYEEFERRRQEEIQRLIEQGLLRPYAPGMVAPPGYEPHPGQFQQPYGQPGMNQHLPPQAHGQAYQGYHPQQGQQFHPQQGQPIHHQQGQPMHPQQGQPMHPQQGQPIHPQQGQPMHPQQAQQFHAQQGQYHPQQGQQFHPQQGQAHPQQGQQLQGQPIHPPQGQMNQGNQYPPQIQPYAGQQQYPNQPHPPSPQGSQGQQAPNLNHPSEPNKPSNNQQLPSAQGTGANPVPANAQPAYGQNGQPQYHDPNQVVPQSANSNNQGGQQVPSVNQGSSQQFNQVPQVQAGQQPVPGNIPAQPASYQQGNAGSQNQIHSDSGKIHNTKN